MPNCSCATYLPRILSTAHCIIVVQDLVGSAVIDCITGGFVFLTGFCHVSNCLCNDVVTTWKKYTQVSGSKDATGPIDHCCSGAGTFEFDSSLRVCGSE